MPDAPPPPRPSRSRRGRVAAGNALRRRTREAVRASDPPTDPIPVWTQPDGVDVSTGRAVVDLAVRVGVALMATGAAASDVVGNVLKLTAAYGLRSLHVDVTFSALTVSYNRGPNADPLAVTRVVRSRNQDFTRLSRLHDVVDSIVAEPVTVSEARERFDMVVRAPHPYRRWVTTVATGAMGAGTSLLLGGGWVVVLTSTVSAAVISRILTTLNRRDVPGFFAQAIGAAVPTVFAILLALLQAGTDLLQGALPSLVVASGIVVLLAGLSLVGAAQDAIEGFYVTAGARGFQVLVLSLGIVIGVVVVLGIASRLGVVLAITPESEIVAGPFEQVVAAAIIGAGWAISTYTSVRSALLTAIAAATGWAVNLAVTTTGTSASFAAALAAAVIGFGVQLAESGRFRFSALAVTTAAIVPLLPGRAVYLGLFEAVSGENGSGLYQGLGTLLGAVGVGMGLAAGVSVGRYAAHVAVQGVSAAGDRLTRS